MRNESKLRPVILVGALIWMMTLVTAHAEPAPKQLLLVAGEASHADGEHEFPDDFRLLAQCLNEAEMGVQATMVEGWPSPEQLEEADNLFLFSDGLEHHVAKGHSEALAQHVAEGRGLGVMHFALEPADEAMGRVFDEALGGYFVVGHSVNPIWTLEEALLPQHPITRGVVFTDPIEDEWYYHIRFVHEIDPVLQAHPPLDSLGEDGPRSGNPSVRQALEEEVPQTLAWTREAPSGTRAFGFTGGHYRFNWSDDAYRTLVLNAMVWTAGIEVPNDGVPSRIRPIPRYGTIDEAIARGDKLDVRRHVGADGERLNQGRNPQLSPLQQAVLRQQVEIACWMIEQGAEVNQADASGRTLLHLAVKRDMPTVVAALMAAGVDASLRDQGGWTPLHHAAARDRLEAMRALLEGGADPMVRSKLGGTPLHEAGASGGAEMARLLLAAGVDPTVKSKEDVTALDVAREYDNEAVIDVLTNAQTD